MRAGDLCAGCGRPEEPAFRARVNLRIQVLGIGGVRIEMRDENFQLSYRLMQTHDQWLIYRWMENWKDLVNFELCPVLTPEEAREKLGTRI